MKKILLLAALFMTGYMIPEPVRAQDLGLEISPAMTVLEILPGSSYKISYTTVNYGDPQRISLKVNPAEPKNNDGNLRLIEVERPFILIEETEKDLDGMLEKDESFIQPFLVTVDNSTPIGDYYYSIFAITEPYPGEQGVASSQISLKVGATLVISVIDQNTTPTQGSIALFMLPDAQQIELFGQSFKVVDMFSPIDVILTVQNKSAHLFEPRGSIILDPDSKSQTTFGVIPEYIPAGWQRSIRTFHQGTITTKAGRTTVADSSKMGKHTLKAEIELPDKSILTQSIDYIALPLTYTKLFFVIFGSLLLGGYTLRKNKTPNSYSKDS